MLNKIQSVLWTATKHKKGRKAKKRPIFVSKRIEVMYAKSLLLIVDEIHRDVASELKKILQPQVSDSVKVADGLFDRFVSGFARLSQAIRDKVASIAQSIAQKIVSEQKKASDEQLSKILYQQTGLDLKGLMRDEDLEQAVAEAIGANVALIKSIPEQYLARVEQAVLSGLQSGTLNQTLADELAKVHDLTKKRAELIATDQLAKINSRLSQIRQQKMGIKHYTWSTSRDERVRHSHRSRDGKLFAWDNPPDDGHAGMAIRCRCVALPYTEHLFDKNAPTPEELMKEQQEYANLVQSQNKALSGWLSQNRINRIAGVLEANIEIQSVAKQYGLTMPEQVALRYYTAEGFNDLNNLFYGNITKDDKHYTALVDASSVLSSALDKLPNYKGIVIRRAKLPGAVLKQHQVGEVVTYNAFTSSTYGVNDVFSHEPHRLVIMSKTGKNINFISALKDDEYEVLFNRPKQFKVMKKSTLFNGVVEIVLEEV